MCFKTLMVVSVFACAAPFAVLAEKYPDSPFEVIEFAQDVAPAAAPAEGEEAAPTIAAPPAEAAPVENVASEELPGEADHEALRGLLKTAKDAINAKDFDQLRPLLDEKYFAVVTADNNKFTTLDAFRDYWTGLFEGPKAKLEKIEIDPAAASETQFVSNTVGIVDGISRDAYYFKNGDKRSMETRWTAVVRKDAGAWKLASIHFSANVLDNPVLDIAKQNSGRYAAAVGMAGLVLGALMARSVCRKKKPAAAA